MNLSQLQHLYTGEGPFTSVHLDVSRDTEDAGHRIETRWAEVRSQLEQAGTPGPVLDRVGDLMTEPTHVAGEVRRTVVADDAEVLLDDVRSGHGAEGEIAERSALPDLTGWLAQTDGELPFILVVADREGADIDAYRAWSKAAATHQEVRGDDLHITKVPLGDWAHKQYQRRSEEVWRHNAGEVADAVRQLWAEFKPRAVVVAGEVRARAEIRSALESSGDIVVEEVEGGGRAPGSSADSLSEDALAVLGRIGHRDREELIEALGAASGQGRPAARGLRNVLEALVQGRVDRLVLDLDATRTETVDPDDYPGLALPQSAVGEGRLPAHQVLVAAGAATDARLSLLPIDVIGSEGVVALLRWEE